MIKRKKKQTPKYSFKDEYQHRNSILRKYLSIYINKEHITVMKPIMRSIKERLDKNLSISIKQFKTLIKYLKNDMKDHTELQLIQFFSPLIYDYDSVDNHTYYETYFPNLYYKWFPSEQPTPTLEEFFQ